MRIAFSIACLSLLLSTIAEASSTLRCGSQLVSKGDSAAEVRTKCGTPLSQDFIGYKQIRDEYGFTQEVAMEEWSYGPRNGMYYFLNFEANRLTSINSRRQN